MANIKISQLPAKGANLGAQDLVEVAEFTGTGYVSKSITGQEIIDAASGGGAAWGSITGTLSSQTDLQTALNAKQNTFGQEALSYTTDLALGSIDFEYNVGTVVSDIFTNYENVQANIFKSYAYRWSNWAFISWTAQSGASWSTLTVNNENLSLFRFVPISGTGTITINSTRIGNFSYFATGCTYNLPNCEYIYANLTISSAVTFTANALKFILGNLSITANSTISMNSLETISANLILGTNGLTSYTNNSLLIIGGQLLFQPTTNTMTSITLDGLKILGGANFTPGTNANLLTTFSFTNIKEVKGNFITNTTIGFTQSTVDHILVKLAELDGTNGTTRYQNKTVTVRGAAPSATGLAAKATLIARGCTVTTS